MEHPGYICHFINMQSMRMGNGVIIIVLLSLGHLSPCESNANEFLTDSNSSLEETLFSINSGDYLAESADSLGPVKIIEYDSLYCSRDDIDTLKANLPGGFWSGPGIWDPVNGLFDPGFALQGIHTIYYEIQMDSCFTRDSVIIEVFESPEIDLGPDQLLCDGEEYILTIDNSALTMEWEDGSKDSERTFSEAGIYWLEVGNVACFDRDTLVITIGEAPITDLGPDIDTCASTVQLTVVDSIAYTYSWDDGSSLNVRDISSNGRYSVTVSTECGEASDVIDVVLDDCECEIYLPNAFSPNGDALNDRYVPFPQLSCNIESMEMFIFNRWGELVYSSTDDEDGWDGVYNDEMAPPGVYVYYLKYRIGGREESRIGEFTLIR